MSNNITVEMVQDELTSISPLYSAELHPELAQDIHQNIRPTDVVEDLRDFVHYALGCFEDEIVTDETSEANFWLAYGYAPSVARTLAYTALTKADPNSDSDDILPLASNDFTPKEYRGALRVGDTVGDDRTAGLSKLWTVDRYRLLDGTENQLPIQVLFLERRKSNGNNERKVVNYFLSPDATNEVVPY